MQMVVDNEVDHAMIPFENSLGGSVHAAYDALLSSGLSVIGEFDLHIQHALMALPGVKLDQIQQVYSHPQALAQCSDYIAAHGFTPVAQLDTAGSAALIAEDKIHGVAAIASVTAATSYNLHVLAENIQDEQDNFTRFLLLNKQPIPHGLHLRSKTCLVFGLYDHVPGALVQALSVFAKAGIDLTKIESRPGKSMHLFAKGCARSPLRYKYFFYLDCLAHFEEPRTQQAIRYLEDNFGFVRVLGSFPSGTSDFAVEESCSVSIANSPRFDTLETTDNGRLPLHLAIIGFGRFGQFLAKNLSSKVFRISVFEPNLDVTTFAAQVGVVVVSSLSELLSVSPDVVIIATPIAQFEGVVKSLPFCSSSLFLLVDVLSVKVHAKEVMTGNSAVPASVDILCTHPMFGPQSGEHTWEGLSFVYERVRISDNARCVQFLSLFESRGCIMQNISCEEHDSYAAPSQFITHFTGRVLSQLLLASTPIDTVGYKSLLMLVKNTCADSDELFKALFNFNRNSLTQLHAFREAVKTVASFLLSDH
uniref:Prephenate dehydratase n=1 Tax=Spongospora subterranea TaxID=70186 RepID=A0A0H5QVM9_9EUKA|eukprot:CRZ06048.1 hypothetical protein [Spongospora subterranea]